MSRFPKPKKPQARLALIGGEAANLQTQRTNRRTASLPTQTAVWTVLAAVALGSSVSSHAAGPAPAAPIDARGELQGMPWTGEMGIQETTAQIMARQAVADQQPSRPRLAKPVHWVDRRNLPPNPDSPAAPRTSLPGRSDAMLRLDHPGPRSPQTAGLNFLGPTLTDTGLFPPDTMGAVGPSNYLVGVNGRLRSYNKTTGLADGMLDAYPDVFFASVMTPAAGTYTSDPRVRYDRLAGRWYVTIIDVPGGTGAGPNRWMLAVSSGSVLTASTVWTLFYFVNDAVTPLGDTGSFADYPTLGVDANALYVGVNEFAPTNYTGTTGFVVRKSSILGAGPIVATAFRNLTGSWTNAGPYTPQGVDNADPAATTGYFIGSDNATYGTLMIRRVSDPGGTPAISANIPLTVSATAYPATVPHFGNANSSSGYLDAVDDRLFMGQIRNGRLWTAQNIGLDASGNASASPSRDGVRWYELENLDTSPSVRQSGTLFDPVASSPLSYWIPSLNVSGQGHVALGFSSAGAAAYINAATCGRLAGDPLGTLQPVLMLTSSSTAYNPPGDDGSANGYRRWGDYSYTSVDPNDDMTFWTIQQYCQAANSYGLRIVRLMAPPPATPASCSPAAVPLGVTTNIALTGVMVSGSGFFDPGAGFSNRIAAAVNGGGVTVNSVLYSNPSNITLNVTVAAGAKAGIRTITVTNPDGQAATSAAGILTVGTPLIMLQPNVQGASFIFSFNTMTGATYQVLYKDALTNATWLTNQTVLGDGATRSITNSIAASTRRFFRLLQQ
jgi:hypothetical protein